MIKSLLGAGTGLMASSDYAFMSYVTEFGKSYGTVAEFEFRKALFTDRHLEIEEFNAGNNTHTLGHNEFSDMTKDEFKKRLGFVGEQKKESEKNYEEFTEVTADASWDWRQHGAVNAVKNQGQCGSCWAFSAVAATEGAYFLKHGTLLSFSEQQLVDCAGGQYHNQGCQGGLMDNAFKYIEANPLETEAQYPYLARKRLFGCNAKKTKGTATVTSYKDIQQSASALVASVKAGPTSVAIEADKSVFQSYKTGVITSAACGTQLDHGVTAVGFGTEGGNPYILVRNSWGPTWGEAGYVKIGQNNICGILQSASRPSEM